MQKILVSIDTEAPVGREPIKRMIYGYLSDGEEYGIRYIMKFLSERGIKGLFFVDIPEAWHYGKDKIVSLIKEIDDNNHDIGVHVHPDHMMDEKRRYLWEYSFEEQYSMIESCTELYLKALGRTPKSFRAGRYGANNDTLTILSKLGYKYDMSEFYGSRYCKINPPITWNRLKKIPRTELIEVPVTTYKSFSCPIYSRNDQLDSGLLCNEFRRNVRIIESTHNVDVISMFMHSFQFLDWRKNPDNPKLKKKSIKRVKNNFEYLLNYPNFKFISESELGKCIICNGTDDIGKVDVSGGILSWYYFGLRAVRVLWDRHIRNI